MIKKGKQKTKGEKTKTEKKGNCEKGSETKNYKKQKETFRNEENPFFHVEKSVFVLLKQKAQKQTKKDGQVQVRWPFGPPHLTKKQNQIKKNK